MHLQALCWCLARWSVGPLDHSLPLYRLLQKHIRHQTSQHIFKRQEEPAPTKSPHSPALFLTSAQFVTSLFVVQTRNWSEHTFFLQTLSLSVLLSCLFVHLHIWQLFSWLIVKADIFKLCSFVRLKSKTNKHRVYYNVRQKSCTFSYLKS